VIKKVLAKSSGNEIFDDSVMASVEKASPFPAPPKRLVNVFLVDGIQLGFPD
jgi:TonB family protein